MKKLLKKDGKAILARTIILFILLAILTVNMLFWYLADKTFSGLITDDAYKKGLNYNDVIAANTIQASQIDGAIFQKRDNHKQILFRSSKNCDSVNFTLFSTTQNNVDLSIMMEEETDVYQWDLPHDITGPWLARVQCNVDGEQYYFSKKINFY